MRSPFFPKPVAGLIVEVFDDDEDEVAVYVFPPGREPMSIPAILFFAQEPDADVRSAAWPA
ncbi:hypothetical protein [Burkholderia gladioli]|uniref:hypothetical protein n=1 Tax=Burkholderia gladioli TaxID=28095 RepID=UPI000B2144AA|nr:hypothetical protein [Burkholderia gladioli]